MIPDILGFQRKYTDGSGSEHEVVLQDDVVEIECQGAKLSIPYEHIDFYIDALTAIKESQRG